jgi:hypothetical protein
MINFRVIKETVLDKSLTAFAWRTVWALRQMRAKPTNIRVFQWINETVVSNSGICLRAGSGIPKNKSREKLLLA